MRMFLRSSNEVEKLKKRVRELEAWQKSWTETTKRLTAAVYPKRVKHHEFYGEWFDWGVATTDRLAQENKELCQQLKELEQRVWILSCKVEP